MISNLGLQVNANKIGALLEYMQPDAAYSFAQVTESNIPHGREIRADASHSANMA